MLPAFLNLIERCDAVTEAEWLICANPNAMLEHLRGKVSERKLRLFGCAVCRVVWHLFTDERSRKAVDVVERYVDGLASLEEMAVAEKAASDARDLAVGPCSNAPRRHRSRAGRCTSWAAYDLTTIPDGEDVCQYVWRDVEDATTYALDAERGHCRENGRLGASLLRDIVGNPFRPSSINPTWLAFNDGTIKKLAQAVYDDRAFERLPILADALEEAGCTDAQILHHCRQSAGHVRGCWVIDLILGKSRAGWI
jgi:hypothetical protein